MNMKIRKATIDDLDIVAQLEVDCFPAADVASREAFEGRLTKFPNHFFIMFDEDKPMAFINGMTTNLRNLSDEMYKDASMHDESGDWQMIFGLATLPEYRRHGYAAVLMEMFIKEAREEGRQGLVLTAKEHMVDYYKRFGYIDEGVSESDLGGSVWYQMRLTF